jgi:uncharacterized protein YjiS (DUF1127 family)
MTQYVLAASEWLNFSGLVDWFRSVKRNLAHQAKVNATIKELSALSDKELRDIGLSRCDIWSVAHEEYLDNRGAW